MSPGRAKERVCNWVRRYGALPIASGAFGGCAQLSVSMRNNEPVSSAAGCFSISHKRSLALGQGEVKRPLEVSASRLVSDGHLQVAF